MKKHLTHHFKKALLIAGCLFLCLLAACASQAQAPTGSDTPPSAPSTAAHTPTTVVNNALLGKNLIVNGDAESGPCMTDDRHVPDTIPGWQRQGTFSVVCYGADGGFPATDDQGPANRGKSFFTGGPDQGADGSSVDNTTTSATQTIDIAVLASLTDSGTISYALSGYFGGYSSQGDNAILTVQFLNASQHEVGKTTLGGVNAKDRQGNTGLLERQSNGKLPKGTRMIKLTLTMNKLEAAYNDGYADNLSLILHH